MNKYITKVESKKINSDTNDILNLTCSLEATLHIYTNSTISPPKKIKNKIYENQEVEEINVVIIHKFKALKMIKITKETGLFNETNITETKLIREIKIIIQILIN